MEHWPLFGILLGLLGLGVALGWALACVGQTDRFTVGFRAGIRVGRQMGMLKPVAGFESDSELEKKEGGR